MAEEKNNELVPVAAEYEVVDQVDDQAIIELMTGQTIQDYVYSFKQGGRTVEGLTLAGINEAANRRGGIQVEEIDYEDREHSWIATAKAVDTITGSSRYGAYEQPKMAGGRPDPFAFTKAIHKAQRNAIKQLIPVPVIREVLNFYLNRKTGVIMRRNNHSCNRVVEISLTPKKRLLQSRTIWRDTLKGKASVRQSSGITSNVNMVWNLGTI